MTCRSTPVDHSCQTPCTHNPLGVKGCGEAGAIGSPPAVVNAVIDALPRCRRRSRRWPHLAGHIGDPQVRNRGTIGGSVANNDPAACYPAAVLGLGATVITNSREIAADDFFLGLFTTALEEGEIVTGCASRFRRRRTIRSSCSRPRASR
jgi:CO/xanthine dehydrogenase FAD-binding subunit